MGGSHFSLGGGGGDDDWFGAVVMVGLVLVALTVFKVAQWSHALWEAHRPWSSFVLASAAVAVLLRFAVALWRRGDRP